MRVNCQNAEISQKILMKKIDKTKQYCFAGSVFVDLFFSPPPTNNLGYSKTKIITSVLALTNSILVISSFWIKRELWLPHQQEL